MATSAKFSTVRYYLCAFFLGLDVWLVRLLSLPLLRRLMPIPLPTTTWTPFRDLEPLRSRTTRGEPAVTTNGAYAIQTNEESEVDINPAYPLNYSA